MHNEFIYENFSFDRLCLYRKGRNDLRGRGVKNFFGMIFKTPFHGFICTCKMGVFGKNRV